MDDSTPSADEVREQLRRMLASKRFSDNRNSAEFLTLVVNRALKGEPIRQSIVGTKLFGRKYDHDSSMVRVTAKKLRAVLAAYYALEGEHDWVTISLPHVGSKDKAYKPVFAFNPRNAASREFTLGEFYLSRGLYGDYEHAWRHYLKALELEARHIGAILGAADTLCGILSWEKSIVGVPAAAYEDRLMIALKLLDSLDDRAVRNWRWHAVGAHICYLLDKNADAQHHFGVALSLDRPATESYAPYIQWLGQIGRAEEAVLLSKRYLDSHIDNVRAHADYAMALIGAVRLDEAGRVIDNAMIMDANNLEVRGAYVNLCLKQYRFADAKPALEKARSLLDPRTRVILGRLEGELSKLIELSAPALEGPSN